jgi:acyl-CoA dehydrogenase
LVSPNLAEHVSAFLVPTHTPGVSIGAADQKIGQSGSQIADVMPDDVWVGQDALLGGQEGRGFIAAMQSLDNGRLSVAAASTGYARRILDVAVRYATERKASETPLRTSTDPGDAGGQLGGNLSCGLHVGGRLPAC